MLYDSNNVLSRWWENQSPNEKRNVKVSKLHLWMMVILWVARPEGGGVNNGAITQAFTILYTTSTIRLNGLLYGLRLDVWASLIARPHILGDYLFSVGKLLHGGVGVPRVHWVSSPIGDEHYYGEDEVIVLLWW